MFKKFNELRSGALLQQQSNGSGGVLQDASNMLAKDAGAGGAATAGATAGGVAALHGDAFNFSSKDMSFNSAHQNNSNGDNTNNSLNALNMMNNNTERAERVGNGSGCISPLLHGNSDKM
jgi:hypothetical protein